MAHLVVPQRPRPDITLFYSVDNVVVADPATNDHEDVLLVQFALQLIGTNPRATTPPAILEVARRVKATNGNIDTQTITAIQLIQEDLRRNTNPSQVVDARVSPAQDYSFGPALFTIVFLNKAVQLRSAKLWPRIDRIDGCPPDLQKMVFRELRGVGTGLD